MHEKKDLKSSMQKLLEERGQYFLEIEKAGGQSCQLKDRGNLGRNAVDHKLWPDEKKDTMALAETLRG